MVEAVTASYVGRWIAGLVMVTLWYWAVRPQLWGRRSDELAKSLVGVGDGVALWIAGSSLNGFYWWLALARGAAVEPRVDSAVLLAVSGLIWLGALLFAWHSRAFVGAWWLGLPVAIVLAAALNYAAL